VFRKKIAVWGICLLAVMGSLAACDAEPEGVETQLGIVADESEIAASFASASAETANSDTPDAETGYLEYITPLGYLLSGKTWEEPVDIMPRDLLMWYAIHERDQNDLEMAEFRAEDGTYRVPKEGVEDTVSQYFGSAPKLLRSGQDTDIFDPDTGEYIINSELPILTQSIRLSRAEEQGSTRKLYFTVTRNTIKYEYLLTVVLDGDSFSYESLVEPDSEEKIETRSSLDEAGDPNGGSTYATGENSEVSEAE
jgi:hypothetical protein